MRLGLGLTMEELGDISYMTRSQLARMESKGRDDDHTSEARWLLMQLVLEKLYSEYTDEEKELRITLGKTFGKRINTKYKLKKYTEELYSINSQGKS
jgi:transcriptional regulator with XRE-family HTH domain